MIIDREEFIKLLDENQNLTHEYVDLHRRCNDLSSELLKIYGQTYISDYDLGKASAIKTILHIYYNRFDELDELIDENIHEMEMLAGL